MLIACFLLNETASDLHRSDLLIYYQIPQNILMGLSKLFLLVASYEFAYFTSRRSGRSFFMGLRYFSIGLSSFIDSLYDHIFPGTDSSINYYVSICQLSFLLTSTFHFIFLVSKRSHMVLEFLHILLHPERCSVNFCSNIYHLSEKISHYQTESRNNSINSFCTSSS